ncbi:MAG: 2Fe-2S iron-sulfur cluster-binding protein, partial [Myxococcota bacterium]
MLRKLFGKKETATYSATLSPSGVEFEVRSRQRLLDAALDRGIDFPHSCRVGGCGTCRCRLLDGEVKEHTDTSYLFSAEEIGRGFILACQSTALTDVKVEVQGIDLEEAAPERRRCRGRVVSTESLTHDIIRLTVELGEPVEYLAGQYADLSVPGIVERPRSYSFSRAPSDRESTSHASFDIRILPNGAFSGWLAGQSDPGAAIEFEGPRGS